MTEGFSNAQYAEDVMVKPEHAFHAQAAISDALDRQAPVKKDLSKWDWSIDEAREVCKLINSISLPYNCHPALTGGLLYKDGPRKDCDIVMYQRGDTKGAKSEIDWVGLWAALKNVGITLERDYGYCKKCLWKGKMIDILDPTDDGTYNMQHDQDVEPIIVSAMEE
jgi:hypothetical protein